MALTHRWPLHTDGFATQTALTHRWICHTDGFATQMALPHRWPWHTDGLNTQMASTHRWPWHVLTGLDTQMARDWHGSMGARPWYTFTQQRILTLLAWWLASKALMLLERPMLLIASRDGRMPASAMPIVPSAAVRFLYCKSLSCA